ncbi:unnamed protein product [Vitrella brassicaformis CCMP3155]|uniref:Uncharacterized protein n=2 Tax=Vitrella brassicaformis TaxID=1169539 RepID=A0A0G4H7C7_VITBC|nr:unnamed protein product [Vitrella brassicaformis CCMP3155]|eukprot:CEM39811.1 unnamed protein product [Vitrella brassicaformis CCMP3155]
MYGKGHVDQDAFASTTQSASASQPNAPATSRAKQAARQTKQHAKTATNGATAAPSSQARRVGPPAVEKVSPTRVNVELLNEAAALLEKQGDKSRENAGVAFIERFVKGFNWFMASDGVARRFTSLLLDMLATNGDATSMVLAQLVKKLRMRPSDEELDAKTPTIVVGRFSFESRVALKQRIRTIMTDAADGEDLKGEDFELLREVLRYHPRADYKQKDCVGIFVARHPNVKFDCRAFFVRRSVGMHEDFSYVRCVDGLPSADAYAYERICDAIDRVCSFFPQATQLLVKVLGDNQPHHRKNVEEHQNYTRSMLWLCRRKPQMRAGILKLFIARLIDFDVEIKEDDPNSIDIEEYELWKREQLNFLSVQVSVGAKDPAEAQKLLNDEERLRQLYRMRRGEEDIDKMAQGLDHLMSMGFDFLQAELLSLSHSPPVNPIKPDPDTDGATPPQPQQPQQQQQQLQQQASSISSKRGRGLSVAHCEGDVLMDELLMIFEQIVLPTHRCRHTQFLLFYATSLKPAWAERFLQLLFDRLYDSNVYVATRRKCAFYIASYVCRAEFLPLEFSRQSLVYLLGFLHQHCNKLAITNTPHNTAERAAGLLRAGSASAYPINPEGNRTLFYAVCQAVCYIVCYHGAAFMADTRNGGLDSILHGEQSLIAILQSPYRPLANIRKGIATELRNLFHRLPGYDYLRPLFEQDAAGGGGDHGGGELEAMTDDSFDPVDAMFPFGPYRLRHSVRFVQDKYRDYAAPALADIKAEGTTQLALPDQAAIRNTSMTSSSGGGVGSSEGGRDSEALVGMEEAIIYEEEDDTEGFDRLQSDRRVTAMTASMCEEDDEDEDAPMSDDHGEDEDDVFSPDLKPSASFFPRPEALSPLLATKDGGPMLADSDPVDATQHHDTHHECDMQLMDIDEEGEEAYEADEPFTIEPFTIEPSAHTLSSSLRQTTPLPHSPNMSPPLPALNPPHTPESPKPPEGPSSSLERILQCPAFKRSGLRGTSSRDSDECESPESRRSSLRERPWSYDHSPGHSFRNDTPGSSVLETPMLQNGATKREFSPPFESLPPPLTTSTVTKAAAMGGMMLRESFRAASGPLPPTSPLSLKGKMLNPRGLFTHGKMPTQTRRPGRKNSTGSEGSSSSCLSSTAGKGGKGGRNKAGLVRKTMKEDGGA